MNILEVHDPQKFRKKAKGVLVVPFAMKDFYYRISKDEVAKMKKTTKLSAAQIKNKVEDMKIRREQERYMRERQVEIAKKKLIDEQNRKLERLRKQKLNTANRQRKVYVDGQSMIDDGQSSIADGGKGQSIKQDESPKPQKGSYRIRKNLAKGLPVEEGKNTKVTMELLQKLHYKDIEQSKPDDFKPENYITDPDDDEDDSVFEYFFPGNKKKKPKKKVKGENYSEKIMNIKKEYNDYKTVRLNQDVVYEEQESMYKSDKESRNTKSHRSIQPSNPGQSKKAHRRVESQITLPSKANKELLKNPKMQLSVRGKPGKLKALPPSTSKKASGPHTSRKNLNEPRSKSRDKSPKMHKSNTKSNILGRIAKIEDMRKMKEKQGLDRAMKTHNNQLRKSQKYLK